MTSLSPERPIQYLHYSAGHQPLVSARVITETAVSLTVNGAAWLTFLCTPTNLEALAIGFLFNEGLVHSKEEILLVQTTGNGTNVDVWLKNEVLKPAQWRRTSGCTGGATSEDAASRQIPVQPEMMIQTASILKGMEQLLNEQELYRSARGVHCSALSDGQTIRFRAEDIGRHNTLDKIAGMLLLEPKEFSPRLIFTTGRISSEMLQKSARLQAAAVISRTSPTSLSIEMAEELGIILIGYARRDQFNVYTCWDRLLIPTPDYSQSNFAARVSAASSSSGVLTFRNE